MSDLETALRRMAADPHAEDAAADRLLRSRSSTMSQHRLRRGGLHPAHRRSQITHVFKQDTTLGHRIRS